MNIDVILSPAELPALKQRDLRDATCVVFDVLRATSTFVTALHHGAKAVVPVSEIAEALAWRQKQPDVLLGGERDGVKIRAAQTGGVDFDFGNSPREYTPSALRACAGAQTVLAAAFLNLTATVKFLRHQSPAQVVLVCAGTYENTALEDVLGAGNLCEMLADDSGRWKLSDAAEIARRTYAPAKSGLAAAVGCSKNARRLLGIPELRDDVPFCLQCDCYPLVVKRAEDGATFVSDSG